MKAIGSVIGAPLKALGLIPKIPKPPPPLPLVTRDDARDAAAKADELRQRRGGLADVITGSGGAEAGRGGKVLLG
jgi:hypothetical protein